MFRKVEALRVQLEKRHDFSIYACFRLIDSEDLGDINVDNLRIFFKNSEYEPTEDELIAIVRRLDVDADAKISYSEFCDAIKCQEASKQEMRRSQRQNQEEKPIQSQYAQRPESPYLASSSQGASRQMFDRDDSPNRSSQQQPMSYYSPSREQRQGPSGGISGSKQGLSGSKRQSPLRPEDESQLIKSFREQMLLERELERAKIDLVEACPDFNLIDAFKLLDEDTKGFVRAFDIQDAFQKIDGLDLEHVPLDDIELFIKRFDKEGDRRLKFSEFCDAFTPLD